MSELKTESRIVDELVEIFNQHKHTQVIDALLPNMSIRFDFTAPEFVDIFKSDQGKFFDHVREAIMRQLEIKHIGFDVRTTFSGIKIIPQNVPTLPMQDINPREHENNIVCFDCQIIAVGQRKSYIKSGKAVCSICGNEDTADVDQDKKIKIPKCGASGCARSIMQLIPNTINTDYIQDIWLQEQVELAKHNAPITFIGKLYGGYVGDVFIGQKKRVTGVFKTVIDQKKNEHNIIIDIISVEDLDENDPQKPDEEQLKYLMQKHDDNEEKFIEDIVKSFAPSIYGHEDVKLSCLLHLASGVPGRKRSEINMALFGDPSMAKSEILKFTSKVAFKSKYTSGKGSSGAGLTIGMVKENDSLVPMAGVLPLHTRGFVQIDEFDKMRTEDRSSMHEVMEQGTCSIAKAGVNLTLEARCSILAAANPKYGRYDEDMTVVDNINIPPALLSRFDMIWLMTDRVDSREDLAKAQHILKTFKEEGNIDNVFMSERDMMAYLNHIRTLKPKLTDSVSKKIEKFYEKMRYMSSQDKDSLPVGIRQLESIIRMGQAHAKLMFRNEVTDDDIECVFKLLQESFSSFGKDSVGDTSHVPDIMNYTNQSKTKVAIKIWNDLSDGTKEQNVFLPLFVNGLIKTEKFDEEDSRKWVSAWEKEGVILKNKNGSYRKSQ